MRTVVKLVSRLLPMIALLLIGVSASADEVMCSGVGGNFSDSRQSIWGQSRLSCSYSHALPAVEGWVRGWAKVDRSTGEVETVIELESDDMAKGPCGKADVELWGGGKELAHIVMDANNAVCMGGRLPGKAADQTKVYSLQSNVSPSIAVQATEVKVFTQALGFKVAPWGWEPNLDDIAKAIQVIALVAG